MKTKEPLPKTIENTLIIFAITVVFLVVIAKHDREIEMTAPEYRHAAEASHGEEPKPEGHGR